LATEGFSAMMSVLDMILKVAAPPGGARSVVVKAGSVSVNGARTAVVEQFFENQGIDLGLLTP